MANASATLVTVVNTAMVVGGSINGALAVGQTVVGANVPGGVTIVSQQTGVGGQQGNYTVTASAANVSVAEPMGFFLFQQLQTIGNASSSQLVDFGLAAGLALLISPANISGTAGPGAQYTFGTHAKAIYDSQAGAQPIFSTLAGPPAKTIGSWIGTLPQYVDPPQPQWNVAQPSATEDKTAKTTLRAIIAAPQQVDFTQQASIPKILVPTGSSAPGAEYHFGTHQKQLIDSQGGTVVWKAVPKPPVLGGQVPLRSFHIQPQEIYQDLLTLQGSFTQPIVETGWLLSMITAGPQLFDFSVQAQFVGPQPLTPKQSPVGIYASPQPDTYQPQPWIAQAKLGATQQVKPVSPNSFYAAPRPQDYTVNQGAIFRSNPQSGQQIQPVLIQAYEQQYDKTNFPQQIFQPIIFNPPIIVPVPQPVPPGPQISVWTTDATHVTADSINFTADGADLINQGGLPTSPTPPESSGGGNPGPAHDRSENLRF